MEKYYAANKSSKMSKSFQGPDRRRYPRFDFPFFIRYKKGEEISKTDTKRENILFIEKDKELSILHDISIGGICFAAKEPFERRTKLIIEIFTPIKSEPFTALVEVIWQKKRALVSTYLTGVSFLQLDDEKEFTHLLDMLTELKLEKIIEK
jgi:hypothetical protein